MYVAASTIVSTLARIGQVDWIQTRRRYVLLSSHEEYVCIHTCVYTLLQLDCENMPKYGPLWKRVPLRVLAITEQYKVEPKIRKLSRRIEVLRR